MPLKIIKHSLTGSNKCPRSSEKSPSKNRTFQLVINKTDDPIYNTYVEKSNAENTKVFSASGITDELPSFSTDLFLNRLKGKENPLGHDGPGLALFNRDGRDIEDRELHLVADASLEQRPRHR